jgi:hypothetical protein
MFHPHTQLKWFLDSNDFAEHKDLIITAVVSSTTSRLMTVCGFTLSSMTFLRPDCDCERCIYKGYSTNHPIDPSHCPRLKVVTYTQTQMRAFMEKCLMVEE